MNQKNFMPPERSKSSYFLSVFTNKTETFIFSKTPSLISNKLGEMKTKQIGLLLLSKFLFLYFSSEEKKNLFGSTSQVKNQLVSIC